MEQASEEGADLGGFSVMEATVTTSSVNDPDDSTTTESGSGDGDDLALILGITIPLVVILLILIALWIYKLKKGGAPSHENNYNDGTLESNQKIKSDVSA